jgi:hypothetical protein
MYRRNAQEIHFDITRKRESIACIADQVLHAIEFFSKNLEGTGPKAIMTDILQ